jgi:hypothetical protein
MNPDQITRALAALPRFDADARRAERTRSLCHASLGQQARSAARATAPISLKILEPLAVIGSFVFLASVIAQAFRIERLIP